MIHLDLKDSFYPFTGLDHDRQIARGIVFDDEGRIYLHYVGRDDIFGKQNYYETPGGGVDEGETFIQALKREIEEELGFEVEVKAVLGEVSDAYNLIKRHNINHYYLCSVLSRGQKHFASAGDNFILSSDPYSITEAIQAMESNEDAGVAGLVKARELPILKEARTVMALLNKIPQEITSITKGMVYDLNSIGRSGDSTFVIEDKYILKISKDKERLKEERDKGDWLGSYLGRGKSLKYIETNEEGYLLREYIKGHTLIEDGIDEDIARLTRCLKSALSFLRRLDKEECPFTSASIGNEFVHGDLCLPNIIVNDNDECIGFIDVSNLGKGDKSYDECWLKWSLLYNLHHEEAVASVLKDLGISISEEDYTRYVKAEL